MKRLMIFLLPVMFLVIMGCVAYVTEENNQNNGRVEGFVHGIVYENITSLPMENIEVSWIFEGKKKTTRTDASGYYAINNLFPGDYRLTFKAVIKNNEVDTLAIRVLDINIPTLSQVGIDDIATGEDFKVSLIENIAMYQKASKAVQGTLYAQNVSGQYITVKNHRITLDFSAYDIIPNKYYVKTGNDGKYSIDNLPLVPGNIQLYVEDSYSEAGNNFTYSTNVTRNVNLSATEIANISDIVMSLNTTTVAVNHSFTQGNNYLPGYDIILTFDEVINQSDFSVELIRYGFDENNQYFENNVALNTGSWQHFRQFTFKPTTSLPQNSQFKIVIKGFLNENNDYFSNVINFTTPTYPSN